VQDFGTSVEDRGVVRAELVNGYTLSRSSLVRSSPGALCKKLQLRRQLFVNSLSAIIL